ncbi:Aldo-keto reductase [Mycena indigotica]|uniref:Aldo-keto reductase n=1 Tax=Mycena indigotica TaxID=2126181 RepID=A0A8H6TAI7_9AGAR|nr:Aldo-keto reductase [Mycena indigotica]KAF7315200.1 Aldo-keto reductase [Mycena indigotica]
MTSGQLHAFKLNNGTEIPSVGLGCYMGSNDFTEKQVYSMVQKAIQAGYRHFDTATGYGNEKQVGEAIRDSGIARSEFYVTTKLANGDHHRVQEAFEESFERLNLEWIDLYLLHWPQASTGDVDFSQINAPKMALPPDAHPTFVETYKEMEKLMATGERKKKLLFLCGDREQGRVKSIGVSNFSIKTLEELLPHCSVVPATNQVELHPCLPQDDLKSYCEAKGILLSAYSPLGRSQTFFAEQPLIAGLADKYHVTWAQIILSWAVQRGTVVLPKSENEGRMIANITLLQLSDQDMHALNTLHRQPGMHRSLVPFHADYGGVFGWTYEWLGWKMAKGGYVLEV